MQHEKGGARCPALFFELCQVAGPIKKDYYFQPIYKLCSDAILSKEVSC